MDCGSGINLAVPVDRMPPGSFPVLSNVRVIEEGRLESRPGYTVYDASASAPKLLHSIRRLNDPDESTAPTGYINVVGNGTVVEAGTEGLLTQIDTGYSGNPLSLITFRPDQSPESWMYAYDQNKLIKVRPDATIRAVGVAPPTRGPAIEYGVPATVDITTAQATTSWSVSPSGTLIGTQDRTAGAGATVSAILYNSGTTGWCCINPAVSGGYNFQWAASRMKVILNSGGGNQEEVLVRDVLPPITATTIQGIQYDSGTSGLCSIVLTGSPSGLARNSLISITNGASQTDIVRVLEVNLSPDGTVYSIRCSTTHTFAATNNITGLESFYTYTTVNHAATETITSSSISVESLSGSGGVTVLSLATTPNASVANGRPIDTANDWISIGIYLTNPVNVVNLQLLVSLDAVPNYSFSNPGNTWTWKITQAQLVALGVTAGNSYENWYEIQIPISSGIHSGDPSLTFASISGIAVQLTTTGVCGWAFDWWYLFGTYGPVIQPNSPVGYLYQTVDRDSTTGAESVPGPQTRYDLFPLRESVIVTPQATAASGVDSLDIYRQGGTLTGFVYVATVGNGTVNTSGTAVTWESGALFSTSLSGTITINGVAYPISSVNSSTSITLGSSAGTQNGVSYTTPFTDGVPDTSILASPAPDLTKIQPWPLLGLPWSGIVNVVGTSVEWVSGTPFNTALLSATVISINGMDYQTYGEPRSTTFLELFTDAGVQTGVPYLIASPTLAAQPLPYAFGPLEGPLAPVVWGLGDPVSGGNIYWTNFSDGDSADDANFLELTPPSEPLISGQVWNGIVVAGSRDNIFLIRYSFVTNSVYQFNRIPSPSGMWTRWTSCRGPDGVYFLGRDGIYLATESGAKNITDAQLYPLFPHDGAPAVGSPALAAVDMTQTGKFMRLSAGDFDIFFDYLDINGAQRTLRFDIPRQRWFPHVYGDNVLLHYMIDQSVTTPSTPQILMLGATSGNIYSSGGNDDNGVAIVSQAQVPYQDGGENRGQKLYIDGMLDCDGTGTLTATVSFNNGVTTFPSQNFTFAGARIQQLLNISSLTPLPTGLSLYRNISCLFSWTGGPAGPRLYIWEPSGYAQPYLSTSIVTQFLSLDFPGGWVHHRRMWPALVSTADATFTIKTQDGRSYTVTIPNTNGQLRTVPQMLPQDIKDLLFAYSLTCPQPFALFTDSFVIECKVWTEPSFIPLAVFKT